MAFLLPVQNRSLLLHKLARLREVLKMLNFAVCLILFYSFIFILSRLNENMLCKFSIVFLTGEVLAAFLLSISTVVNNNKYCGFSY